MNNSASESATCRTVASMSGSCTVRAATTLALWAAAWQGGVSADDVLAAVDDAGHRAGVRAATAEIAAATGLPGPGQSSAGSAALLPLLREGGPPDLLLPRAGDMRGLPLAVQRSHGGPGTDADFVIAALDAGALVRLPALAVALVPADGQWRAFACPTGHPPLDLRDASELLDHAIAGATRTLAELDVARTSPQAREAIRLSMLAQAVRCPPGTPAAASSLLARAISMQALLGVATGHETAAATSYQVAAVDDALRPLAAAVAECRRAAVGTAVPALRAVRSLRRPAAAPPRR